MFNAVELTWYRCRDGYKLVKPTPVEHLEESATSSAGHAVTVLTGITSADDEPRMVPVSGAREPYYAAGDLVRSTAKSGIGATEAFMRSKDDAESVLQFYNDYGPLRPPRRLSRGEWQHDVWYGPEWEMGEKLSDWTRLRGDVTTILERVEGGNLIEAAKIFDQNRLGSMHLGMRKEGNGDRWRPILQPDSLWHLIWLDLGLTLTGGAQIRPCQVCHKPMLIGGATGGKQNRMTCSAKCRFEAFKQRKAKRSPVL